MCVVGGRVPTSPLPRCRINRMTQARRLTDGGPVLSLRVQRYFFSAAAGAGSGICGMVSLFQVSALIFSLPSAPRS